MKYNRKCLLSLVAFALLFSCARTPQQNVSENLTTLTADHAAEKGKASVVRVVSWVGTTKIGNGSGFFVEPDKIVTNIHVVAHPGPIFVKLVDEEAVWAVEGVTAFDVENDLVILKIAGEGKPLPLGNSNRVQINESVYAIGYPDGRYNISTGVIDNIRNKDRRIHTTAHTDHGNSGGPVLNDKGEVIGITVAGDYIIPSGLVKILLSKLGETDPITQWRKRKLIRAYAYMIIGDVEFADEDYEKAISNYNKGIHLNSDFIYGYSRRAGAKYNLAMFEAKAGNVKKAQGLYEAAIEDYTQVIKFDPEYPSVYAGRAAAKLGLGHFEPDQRYTKRARNLYEAAIEDYSQEIRRYPNATAYNHRGVAKYYLGKFRVDRRNTVEIQRKYEAAIEDFTQAIRLDRKAPSAYTNRAGVKVELGDLNANQKHIAQDLYEKAIEDCTQAIKLNPKYAKAYSIRALAKCDLGKSKADQDNVTETQQHYRAAIEDCSQAVELKPEYAMAYVNRAWARYLLGESETTVGSMGEARKLYEAAIVDSDRAIQLDPNDADPYHTKGAAKVALGDSKGAIEDFDKAIHINPGKAIFYYDRALAKEMLGQHEAAKADFQKAKELGLNLEK